MQVVRRLAVVAMLLSAFAACGNENGPGGPGSVALLTYGVFVEYDTTYAGAEASELEFTIRSFGIAVAPVTAYDSASLAAVLTQNSVFIIPEQENSPTLADSLSAGAKTVLRHFVDSLGGTLITSTHYELPLLDTLFGYGLVEGSSDVNYQLNGGATGTTFAGGPALLWDNDGTYPVEAASLPAGAKIIYQGISDGVVVAAIPEGRGTVVLIAWDWYNAAPHGSQDGGWNDALLRAIRY